MSAYAGIDFDTYAVHVVLIPEVGLPAYHPFVLDGMDAFERTRSVRDAMPPRGWWRDEGVIAIGLEHPQGSAKSTVAMLMAIQGATLSCLPRDLLVNPMRPGSWRAGAGLAGNASKDEVRLFVHDQLGTDPYWPQDACDAYCLALAVRHLTVNLDAA